MNIRYKMNKKFIGSIFTVLSIVMTFCLCGCQNEAVASVGAVSVSGGTAVLTLNIDNEAGRSAMPVISSSELTKIELFAADTDTSGDGRKIGEWESVEELNAAKISIYVGTWTFTLKCETSTLKFSDRQTVTVTAGTNVLTFRPKSSYDKYDTSGVGNLSVTINYPSEGVEAVTCGLYSLGGISAGAIYPDEDLTIDITANGSSSVYTLTDVSCDRYFAVFKFYGDADKTLLRGTYCEYCWIINGMTSTSNCTVEEIAGLFNIEYELNGGSFAGGSAVYRSYTRYSDTITLPEVAKANCIFGGWYDNAEFTGNPVRTITEGSTGNRTYYAKWVEHVTVTFDKNNENAAITTSTQTMPVVQANLPLASALGLTHNAGNKFLGWAAAADGEVQYTDGDTVAFMDNTTLYAVWSATAIDPAGEDDTTDTDGDSLTDWYELNVSHTDPNNNDTDGDGWTDKKEVDMYDSGSNTFSPLIADVPAIEVILTEKPKFEFDQRNNYIIAAIEIENNNGVIGSSLSPKPCLRTRKETNVWSCNYGPLGNCGRSGDGYEITPSFGFYGGVIHGDSYIYAQETSGEWASLWVNGQLSKSSFYFNQEPDCCRITVKYKFKNNGKVACDLKAVNVKIMNIPVGSSEVSEITYLGENEFKYSNVNVGVIQPQGESEVFEKQKYISMETAEKLMKWSAGINAEITGSRDYNGEYQIYLSTDHGEKYYSKDKVKSQTAALFIDYGNGSTSTYNVAANNRFNVSAVSTDNLYFQNDLEYVFNTILDMSGDYELSDEGYIRSINGIANAADAKDGAWYIGHKYTEGGKRYLKTYSPYTLSNDKTHWKLSDIKISAGDEISIIYAKDADNDGVPLNEEIMYGTDDTKSDTDGDGLSDYEEIYGWYKDGIGLDVKYSDSNKVYTNPKIADTDGDELPDCSMDSDQCDNDPLYSGLASDTGIRCSYQNTSFVRQGNREDVVFDEDGKYNIGDYGSVIYVIAYPVCRKATVEFKFGEEGEFSYHSGWDDPYVLPKGENKIYIRCTSMDRTAQKIYELTVNSAFYGVSGFSAYSPVYREEYNEDNTPKIVKDLYVNFNWNPHDGDAATASDGGYIMYGHKFWTDSPDELELPREAALAADYTVADIAGRDYFYIRLTPEDLVKGSYRIDGLPKQTWYRFTLFAYTGADSESTYRYAVLGLDDEQTGIPRYAELNIYGHYVVCTADHDGITDSSYYWSFNNNGVPSESYTAKDDVLNLSTFDCYWNYTQHVHGGAGEASYDYLETNYYKADMSTNYSYWFGDNPVPTAVRHIKVKSINITTHKNSWPAKFSGCTRSYSTIFDRTRNYSFTQTWEAWEADSFTRDDYLGKVTATFTYTATIDTWTCSWSSTCGASSSSTITAGQRTGKPNGSKDDGLRWELHNTDEGEIEFHWDWGWDE